MPSIFNAFRTELGVQALPAELESMSFRTRQHLRSSAAEVSVQRLAADAAGSLTFDVVVRNLAGHKLPTAYPSRRAWLHVVVTDGAGRVVFESGALRPDGGIVGNDNDRDASRYEPHHQVIRSTDQVQVYEAILAGPDGRVTTGLIKGVRYLKDNRILPSGFDKAGADADIAVRGGAAEDADFVAGTDRVRFQLDTVAADAPLEVVAELWYQPIGFRWAHNLAAFDAVKTNRFVRYFDALSEVSGTLLARAVQTTD
jgi:hypothetical protein